MIVSGKVEKCHSCIKNSYYMSFNLFCFSFYEDMSGVILTQS